MQRRASGVTSAAWAALSACSAFSAWICWSGFDVSSRTSPVFTLWPDSATSLSTRALACAEIQVMCSGTRLPGPRTSRTMSPRRTESMYSVAASTVGAAGLSLRERDGDDDDEKHACADEGVSAGLLLRCAGYVQAEPLQCYEPPYAAGKGKCHAARGSL